MKKILGLLLVFVVTSVFAAEALKNVVIPSDTKVDWMELKSGEWVRGEFKGVYSGKVEFDSEEFDLVKFDLDDVQQIVTVGKSMINLNADMPHLGSIYKLNMLHHKDNEVLGNLSFQNDEFIVKLEDNSTKVLPRETIASISAGEPKESNYWSANISLGLDILSGNSDQVSATLKADAERRTALTRFRADYLSSYTLVDTNITTADNKRLSGSFDLYQTSHFYWRLASLEYSSDAFKNLDRKYTVSAGAGYDIIYTDTIDWSVTMGPGYQETRYITVVLGEDIKASTPLLFLDTRYSQEVSDDVDFILNYSMYYVNEESGEYSHHAETSLKTEFINDLTVNLTIFWDRVKNPIADDNGIFPGKDDFKTMFFIGYSY